MQTRYKGTKEETKTVQDTNITTGQQEKLNLPDLITQQSHNKWNQKYAIQSDKRTTRKSKSSQDTDVTKVDIKELRPKVRAIKA